MLVVYACRVRAMQSKAASASSATPAWPPLEPGIGKNPPLHDQISRFTRQRHNVVGADHNYAIDSYHHSVRAASDLLGVTEIPQARYGLPTWAQSLYTTVRTFSYYPLTLAWLRFMAWLGGEEVVLEVSHGTLNIYIRPTLHKYVSYIRPRECHPHTLQS